MAFLQERGVGGGAVAELWDGARGRKARGRTEGEGLGELQDGAIAGSLPSRERRSGSSGRGGVGRETEGDGSVFFLFGSGPHLLDYHCGGFDS